MLNGATVTLAGYVAREPALMLINETTPKVTMRVAWTSRYQDRVTGEWKDGNTSFATVNCWRKLAGNVAASLRKGHGVVVTGKLQVREYDDREGRRRVAVDIEADSIGHDLTHAVTHLLRTPRPAGPAGADSDQTGQTGLTGLDGTDPAAASASQAPDGDAGTSDDVVNAEAVTELAGSMQGSAAAVPF